MFMKEKTETVYKFFGNRTDFFLSLKQANMGSKKLKAGSE